MLIMRAVRRPAEWHATIGIMWATVLLVLVVVLVIGGLVFGVVSLLSGDDPGLVPAEPDERALPLPNDRSLREEDLKQVRFDVAVRGYRMAQVDRMLRRTAYDLGYKDEMIAVLEAEVIALREGRLEDADLLNKAREGAATPSSPVDLEPRGLEAWAPATADELTVTVDDDADEAGSAEIISDTDHADDPAVDEEPDLPREGSLRRREPVAADAMAGADGTATHDGADRPAHA
jgi:DivIVA domain-containing protein